MVLGGCPPAVEALNVHVPHHRIARSRRLPPLQADADLLPPKLPAFSPVYRLHSVAGSQIPKESAVLAGDGGEAGRAAGGGEGGGNLEESQVMALPGRMEQQGMDLPGVGAEDEGEGVQVSDTLEQARSWNEHTGGAD